MMLARLLAILPVLVVVVPRPDALSQSAPVLPARTIPNSGHHSFAWPPLYFEVNRGQADRQVRYVARSPGSTLFLTSNQAVLTVAQAQDKRAALAPFLVRPRRAWHRMETVLRLQPVGQSRPSIIGLDPL